jgi:hypothetical protein
MNGFRFAPSHIPFRSAITPSVCSSLSRAKWANWPPWALAVAFPGGRQSCFSQPVERGQAARGGIHGTPVARLIPDRDPFFLSLASFPVCRVVVSSWHFLISAVGTHHMQGSDCWMVYISILGHVQREIQADVCIRLCFTNGWNTDLGRTDSDCIARQPLRRCGTLRGTIAGTQCRNKETLLHTYPKCEWR